VCSADWAVGGAKILKMVAFALKLYTSLGRETTIHYRRFTPLSSLPTSHFALRTALCTISKSILLAREYSFAHFLAKLVDRLMNGRF
jgi:hypothetical protein